MTCFLPNHASMFRMEHNFLDLLGPFANQTKIKDPIKNGIRECYDFHIQHYIVTCFNIVEKE